MKKSRRHTREIVGYGHDQQSKSADSWLSIAQSFHWAADLLHRDRKHGDARPFAFNAAHSLELIVKGILVNKQIDIPNGNNGHNLRFLTSKAKIKLSREQQLTLELFAELIVWAGRYPTPKTAQRWDYYHDVIMEKHIIRSKAGKTHTTLANPDTFPGWANYQKIWEACMAEFLATKLQS